MRYRLIDSGYQPGPPGQAQWAVTIDGYGWYTHLTLLTPPCVTSSASCPTKRFKKQDFF